MIGKRLLHYEILEKLGQGGMGEVYRARDAKLDRDVALKVLSSDTAGDAERRMRFEREAKAVAALKHPNIVTIFSVEEDQGSHFITMELVDGKTLAELIPSGGLSVDKFFQYATPLAEALTSAHNKGITHRDLKPANVMVNSDGELKVLDFGLAKLQSSPGGDLGRTVSGETATAEGKVLGTVAYMAPEQAEGKPADPRSDVFSLGVLFYEMATGDRPFKGDTNISTITSILRDDPPSITELKASVPRHLSRIIKRSLAKDPDRRYQSAHDLRNDLLELREEIESGEVVAPSQEAVAAGRTAGWRNTALWALVAAVVVVGGGLGVLQLTGDRGGESSNPGPARNMEITRITSTGKSIDAAISPDGRYVAHVLDDHGKSSLWVTQVSTSSSVEIVPAGEDQIWDPIFSSTGEFVYYIREGDPFPNLIQVPVLGGTSRLIVEHVNQTITFSPDGSQIGFLRETPATDQIVIANVDGTEQRVLKTLDLPEFFSENPAWSPDGKVIVVSVGTQGQFNGDHLIEISIDGGSTRRLSDRNWIDLGEIAWYPEGNGLVFIAQEDFLTIHLWEISYPAGEVRRITNDISTYNGISVTQDGNILAVGQDQASFNLWVATPGSSEPPRQITTGANIVDQNCFWASDGKILYHSTAGGSVQIWSVNADGSGHRRLSSDFANAVPLVTPDGKTLVFAKLRDSRINIWRSNREMGNAVALTDAVIALPFDISPDGKWIVSLDFTKGTVIKRPIDGGEPVPLTEVRANSPVLSPDGKLLAVRSWDPEARKTRTYIYPFEEMGPVIQVLDVPSGTHRWSPDGNTLVYADVKDGVSNLWSQALDGGDPLQLTHFDDMVIQDFAWSPDGKQLVMTRGRRTSDVVLVRNFR